MGDIGLNRYSSKYNLTSILILMLFILIDLVFYLLDFNSTLVLVIINIFIGLFLIIFYKFPEVLRIYNISKESQEAIDLTIKC